MNDTPIVPTASDTELVTLDEWRAALAKLTDIAAIKSLHDIAEIHRKYGETDETQRRAGLAKLEAAYRGGQILADDPDIGKGRTPKEMSHRATLSDYGLTRDTSSRWQRITALGRQRLTKYERYIESEKEDPSYNGYIHWSEKGRTQSSDSNEWYTPALYVDRARDVLGGFDLDPASNELANKTVRAKRFFDIDDDGLAQPWKGKVWLNPPYGRIAGDFIERLIEEHDAGNVTAAIALVNANSTDTAWFQPLWDHTLCFTNHRIDFIKAGTSEGQGSTHGSAFIYLGDDPQVFAALFKDFGTIVRRWPK